MSEGNICDLNCIMEQYTGKNIIYNTKIMHKEAIFTPSTLCTGKNRVPGTVPCKVPVNKLPGTWYHVTPEGILLRYLVPGAKGIWVPGTTRYLVPNYFR